MRATRGLPNIFRQFSRSPGYGDDDYADDCGDVSEDDDDDDDDDKFLRATRGLPNIFRQSSLSPVNDDDDNGDDYGDGEDDEDDNTSWDGAEHPLGKPVHVVLVNQPRTTLSSVSSPS